jgi:type IV pilus assembly protein PilW
MKRRESGFSIIELMVAITLGLLVLGGLAALFANASASRNELERNSRQIENGRFAIELLSDDLRLAGFYGELNVRVLGAPTALPDPCSANPADWATAIPVHVFGYDNGAGAPPCMPGNVKPNTDIIVVRRVSTCEAGVAGCSALNAARPYIQTSRCSNQIAATAYRLGIASATTWDMMQKNCDPAATTGRRRYHVHIYYIATDNGAGVQIPTLTRLDFNGVGFQTFPMVEGIEEMQFEYGIDIDGDGNVDGYGADPNTWTMAGCGACNALNNWGNVMSVRISLLARNIDPSPRFTDNKTYVLGRDAADAEITLAPPHFNDPTTGFGYRRHAYTGLVRVVNAAQRRETP